MNYDSPVPLPQGAMKLSEIFTDRVQALLGSQIGESAILVLEQMLKANIDSLRRHNYILRSEGRIQWSILNTIKFDADVTPSNMEFYLLHSDTSVQRTIRLRLVGGATNTTSAFNSIALADGELLYLELDPATIFDNSTTSFDLENAVGGGSLVSGRTVKKVQTSPGTSGLPQLSRPLSGTATTLYIPLALRKGVDIHWIPHGIFWPSGTTSPLGAIIVDGFTAYPEQFVDDQVSLQAAMSALSGLGGGVALITNAFSIDQTITVPANVKILGRGMGKNAITMLAGSAFVLNDNSDLDGLRITASAGFTGNMINTNGGEMTRIQNCRIDISATTNVNTNVAIRVQGNWTRTRDCRIIGVVGTNRIGVNYVSGSNNADVDIIYT